MEHKISALKSKVYERLPVQAYIAAQERLQSYGFVEIAWQ